MGRNYLWIASLIFVLGFLCSNLYAYFAEGEMKATDSLNQPAVFYGDKTYEKASPYDRIKEEQIIVKKDSVIIVIPNETIEWAGFTDTNSMDPLIDAESNAIEIVPKNAEDIHVGDVISYQKDGMAYPVIHRVIYIGNDEQGWYALTKGDNNGLRDPYKIRFDEVKRILVAVIY